MVKCFSNYSAEDISQTDSKKASESQPSIEPPVAKKRKVKAVNNSHPAVDNAQDLFNQPNDNDGSVELPAATQVTDSTKRTDKVSATDKDTINENTTTSTTNADNNIDGTDNSRTSATSDLTPSAAAGGGGGRVIKIKRRKMPVDKDNVDADSSSELQQQKSIPEPDSIHESQVETTRLSM